MTDEGITYPDVVSVYDDGTMPYVDTQPVFEQTDIYAADTSGDTKAVTTTENFTSFNYSGTVIDEQTGAPLTGATVSLYNGSQLLGKQAANSKGEFIFTTEMPATGIQISYIDYKTISASAGTYNNNGYYLIPMQIEENKYPPVIVTTIRKNYNWIVYAGLGLAYLREKNKGKSVGKIETSHILTIGAGIALFLGFDTIKKIFEGIGFWNSQDTKNLDEESSNPYSPWSPQFLDTAPAGTWLLTDDTCIHMYGKLFAAWGYTDDDEDKAIGVFKALRTQSELASFAAWMQNNGHGDLLQYLRGGAWPNDRLSDSEVAQINDYIKRLPKYTA